jgi:3-dehydroquinate synthase
MSNKEFAGHVLQVGLGDRSYPIYIGQGLLDDPKILGAHLGKARAAIITNDTIAPLYLERLRATLDRAGVASVPIILADGEDHKNWQTLNLIFDNLLRHRCERNTVLIALGGGVVGDMSGFAAATYMRGVPFIQIPTTLLSQVDSSVGGKTGINHPLGKNMIGAFYQPRAVLSDIDTLISLPERELSAGLAEVIKYGLIDDPQFFNWLEQNLEFLLRRDGAAMSEAVARCCANKARIVAADETEQGVRALLNLGHTFGHAIEAGLGFGTWLHGEAVAAGCVMAAELSERMGLLTTEQRERTVRLFQRARLPIQPPRLGVERYLELMGHDKKVQGGKLRLILLRGIGAAFITSEFQQQLLRDTLACERVYA